MFKRRSSDGFNLAFLDVMACGLGAIILILMLVKFNATTEVPNDELERLQQELAALQKNSANAQASLESVEKNIAAENADVEALKKRIQQLKVQQNANQRALNDKRAVLADVEQSVAAAAPRQADDNVALQGVGEENYLLGLKVEGQYVGVLVDTSASMTDEKLRQIIRRKIGNNIDKQNAPKWQRTKRVVRWLLARLPQSSKVSVVSFNNIAKRVGTRNLVSAKNTTSMKQLSAAIDQLVPRNGTNLQLALSKIKEISPKLTHLYVVTDGLPTLGKRSAGLSAFANCGSLFGKSKTITGECRVLLFNYTVQQAALSGVEVNVILLPLEGDPQAPQAYWNWTAATGGLMLSPAGSWP